MSNMPCPLCRDDRYDNICPLCELVRFQTQEILNAYSSGEVTPDEMRFFVPELSFTFERDHRTRRLFNIAYEIVGKAITMRNQEIFAKRRRSPIDTEVVTSPYMLSIKKVTALRNLSEERIRKFDKVLRKARIARLEGETIYLEEMAQRLVSDISEGADLSAESYQHEVKEMKGILCAILADALIRQWLDGDVESGRPRKYVAYMKCLSRFVEKYWEEKQMPKEISIRNFFKPSDLQISSIQAEKTFAEDVLGLGPGQSNIIQSFREKSDGKIILLLKEPVVRFLERIRERWRERPRER